MQLTPKTQITRDTAPNSEPISLSEAKLFLRVDHSDEDAAISQMIQSVRETAEEILGSSLIQQRWLFSVFGAVPLTLRLPYGPVSSVITVTSYNREGLATIQDVNTYRLRDPHALAFDVGICAERTDILFEAGMGTSASDVPAALKQNMLQHLAYLYGFRSLDDAERMHDITRLYAPFREVQL